MQYYINGDNEFVIEDYNSIAPFSNFLPGIAGLFGIPMWVFYVNRGQAVCSCGIQGKDNPIMEFMPANRAYQLTTLQGFRTFIKISNKNHTIFYEPFQPHSKYRFKSVTEKMYISGAELRIQEINRDLGIEINVGYFTIPNEPFAALCRIVDIKNISKKDFNIEVLDGTPIIMPYGINNFFAQKMRRTIEAWMIVENLENNAPFYRLKVDARDTSEVKVIKEGNFYFTSVFNAGAEIKPKVIADSNVIFNEVNDFSYPVNFVNTKPFKVPKVQIKESKLPCAMAFADAKLKKEASLRFNSIIGHMDSKEKLNSFLAVFRKQHFLTAKQEENKHIIAKVEDNIFTVSNDKRYDMYCGQTFLDNVLRGGLPIVYQNHAKNVFYVYLRKHGDLERDYNRFSIEPAYFSQGDGNFRDINQNRRSDVLFNPNIGDFNIFYFYNLIQADGFNPLVLKGLRFKIKKPEFIMDIIKDKVADKDYEKVISLLSGQFTPGELFMKIERNRIKIIPGWDEFLAVILKNSSSICDAEHCEGYWIDHWTYNMDLVESFLKAYPEKLKEVLLDKKEITFYDNMVFVKPRSRRYLLLKDGVVRQYHSLEKDSKKEHLIKKREIEPHTARAGNGEGDIYKTTLLGKMLCIIANKTASFDAFGVGIEMEADKPGWCDSLNGLPGLCGSSLPEVFELKRQVQFIIDSLNILKLGEGFNIDLAEEIYDFLKNIEMLLTEGRNDFYFWDKGNEFKEAYRDKVRYGFSGREKSMNVRELEKMMQLFLEKIDKAVQKAYIPSKKAYATYFINEICEYELLGHTDPGKNLPFVKPLKFKSSRLPLFLEGNVRAMKTEKEYKKAKALYTAVRKSALYDKKLKMYKVNEPLGNISKEIGRSSIFTPGWLENESIWLHMEYKYLLELLKTGLYEEFFEEFRDTLIPFQKPERYGRSILENSSFICSSAFPDTKLHGKGFVARLSGSTAELLNIWLLMNAGMKPFFIDEDNQLNLKFEPVLPAWLFTKKPERGFPKNIFAFRFLGTILVVYHNPKMKDTAGKDAVRPVSIVIEYPDGKKIDITSGIIPPPCSEDIRSRKVSRIDIRLG